MKDQAMQRLPQPVAKIKKRKDLEATGDSVQVLHLVDIWGEIQAPFNISPGNNPQQKLLLVSKLVECLHLLLCSISELNHKYA